MSKYMERCIELARLGLGYVAPNPMVGAVLVYEDRIIGEGYHKQYGEAHAEVNALNAVAPEDRHLIAASTLYVNLEPCSHFGKTPPCSDLILKNNIPKVVIGCTDTFEKVSGTGIVKLREAGVDVTEGILREQSRELNKRFFTFHEKKRPYIILKWAQTLNGLLCSSSAEDDKQISNSYSKKLVHKWRSEEAAIMVGTNTAFNDNPHLTVREWTGKNPVRVVIDKTLRLPSHLHLFDQSVPTLVFTEKEEQNKEHLEYEKIDFSTDTIASVLNILHQRNIQSVIIEGGSSLLKSFIDKRLWDEARISTGNKTFAKGVAAPFIDGKITSRDSIKDDTLLVYQNAALEI